MLTQSKRLFLRYGCHLPIEYRTSEADEYRAAVVFNRSRNGMYFEQPTIVMPEENLYIFIAKYSPSAEGPESFCYYQARAVWCHSIADESGLRYGCGARLIKRSSQPDGINAQCICYTCDMCGALTPCQDLRKTENSLYLCSSCEWHLFSVPEGNLRESIEDFVAGNIV
jgi:hypothetical protein